MDTRKEITDQMTQEKNGTYTITDNQNNHTQLSEQHLMITEFLKYDLKIHHLLL